MDSQHQERVTQEFPHLGFEGNQSKTTCPDCIFAVKSSFLASLRDAFTKAIPFRGFPLRCNPRLHSAIASRSKLLFQTSPFHRQISFPALSVTRTSRRDYLSWSARTAFNAVRICSSNLAPPPTNKRATLPSRLMITVWGIDVTPYRSATRPL